MEMQATVYIFSICTNCLSTLHRHSQFPLQTPVCICNVGGLTLHLTRARPCSHIYLTALSWQSTIIANVKKINRDRTFGFFFPQTQHQKLLSLLAVPIARGSVNKGEALSSTHCVQSSSYALSSLRTCQALLVGQTRIASNGICYTFVFWTHYALLRKHNPQR